MNWIRHDYDEILNHYRGWWNHSGFIFAVGAPRVKPIDNFPEPIPPASDNPMLDHFYRIRRDLYRRAKIYYGGDAFPMISPGLGCCDLAPVFGAEMHVEPHTTWYEPCIDNPDNHEPTADIDWENSHWINYYMESVAVAKELAKDICMVTVPAVFNNLDTLAAIRGNESLLIDLIERPDWVRDWLAAICRAELDAFRIFHENVRSPDGANGYIAFSNWGPGKTATLQCDFSCMISRDMFDEFVIPVLEEQCRRLDYSVYHLDGTTAMHHLDSLLTIKDLDAIEWTPEPGFPQGGDPSWYDLYRRILKAGKSVEMVNVKPEEIRPIFESLGTDGLYICARAENPEQVEQLEKEVRAFR